VFHWMAPECVALAHEAAHRPGQLFSACRFVSLVAALAAQGCLERLHLTPLMVAPATDAYAQVGHAAVRQQW
jgi:hypothetical protein